MTDIGADHGGGKELSFERCLLRGPAVGELEKDRIKLSRIDPERIPTRVEIARLWFAGHVTTVEKHGGAPGLAESSNGLDQPVKELASPGVGRKRGGYLAELRWVDARRQDWPGRTLHMNQRRNHHYNDNVVMSKKQVRLGVLLAEPGCRQSRSPERVFALTGIHP